MSIDSQALGMITLLLTVVFDSLDSGPQLGQHRNSVDIFIPL
jgi:hypothetical protein